MLLLNAEQDSEISSWEVGTLMLTHSLQPFLKESWFPMAPYENDNVISSACQFDCGITQTKTMQSQSSYHMQRNIANTYQYQLPTKNVFHVSRMDNRCITNVLPSLALCLYFLICSKSLHQCLSMLCCFAALLLSCRY